MRVSQTDNLTRIAGVGEDFLVTGETGVENDFSAAARNGASRAAIKYAAVFECKDCGSMLYFRQLSLRRASLFFTRFRWGQRAKVIYRPVGKYCSSVYKLARHRPKHA